MILNLILIFLLLIYEPIIILSLKDTHFNDTKLPVCQQPDKIINKHCNLTKTNKQIKQLSIIYYTGLRIQKEYGLPFYYFVG
jgi:hypothetical protein